MATTYTQNYKAESAKSIISIVVTNFTVFQEFQEALVKIGLTNFAYHREIKNKKTPTLLANLFSKLNR